VKRRLSTRGDQGEAGFHLLRKARMSRWPGSGRLFKLAVFLAEEEFSGGIEHGDGGNTAIKGTSYFFGGDRDFCRRPMSTWDDYEIFSRVGTNFGLWKGFVEGVAVKAPIGAENDKNTFCARARRSGALHRFPSWRRRRRIELFFWRA